MLLLYILPKRHYYKQKKFKYAEDMGPEAVRDVQSQALQGPQPLSLRWGVSCSPEADICPPNAHTAGAGPCGHQLHPGPAGEHEDVLTSAPAPDWTQPEALGGALVESQPE